MTLPNERYKALLDAEQFLVELLNPKSTPRVPRAVRKRSGGVLRHFPTRLELSIISTESQLLGAPQVPRKETEFDPAKIKPKKRIKK